MIIAIWQLPLALWLQITLTICISIDIMLNVIKTGLEKQKKEDEEFDKAIRKKLGVE
jgi:hypothetical protein